MRVRPIEWLILDFANCMLYFMEQHLLPLFLIRFSYEEIVHRSPLGSTVAFTTSICLNMSLTITGMREAAGGRQPAAAKPLLYHIESHPTVGVQQFFLSS